MLHDFLSTHHDELIRRCQAKVSLRDSPAAAASDPKPAPTFRSDAPGLRTQKNRRCDSKAGYSRRPFSDLFNVAASRPAKSPRDNGPFRLVPGLRQSRRSLNHWASAARPAAEAARRGHALRQTGILPDTVSMREAAEEFLGI